MAPARADAMASDVAKVLATLSLDKEAARGWAFMLRAGRQAGLDCLVIAPQGITLSSSKSQQTAWQAGPDPPPKPKQKQRRRRKTTPAAGERRESGDEPSAASSCALALWGSCWHTR